MRVDWSTVSSLATAGGTLVLAIATFASVRSANRAARTTERSLLVGLRPVLFPSRPEDPTQKLRWGDDHWAVLPGGRCVLEEADGVIYLAMSLRNVGSGIAVLRSWRIQPEELAREHTGEIEWQRRDLSRPPLETFRPQSRDIYVPPGGDGFWQGAIRRPDDPDRGPVQSALHDRRGLWVDLLYGDQEGGQETISRFSVTSHPSKEEDWICSVVRHWHLDRPHPRRGDD